MLDDGRSEPPAAAAGTGIGSSGKGVGETSGWERRAREVRGIEDADSGAVEAEGGRYSRCLRVADVVSLSSAAYIPHSVAL